MRKGKRTGLEEDPEHHSGDDGITVRRVLAGKVSDQFFASTEEDKYHTEVRLLEDQGRVVGEEAEFPSGD